MNLSENLRVPLWYKNINHKGSQRNTRSNTKAKKDLKST